MIGQHCAKALHHCGSLYASALSGMPGRGKRALVLVPFFPMMANIWVNITLIANESLGIVNTGVKAFHCGYLWNKDGIPEGQ